MPAPICSMSTASTGSPMAAASHAGVTSSTVVGNSLMSVSESFESPTVVFPDRLRADGTLGAPPAGRAGPQRPDRPPWELLLPPTTRRLCERRSDEDHRTTEQQEHQRQ